MPDPVLKVRISSSSPATVRHLADSIAALDGWEVLERSEPVANRREAGGRVYLKVREKEGT